MIEGISPAYQKIWETLAPADRARFDAEVDEVRATGNISAFLEERCRELGLSC